MIIFFKKKLVRKLAFTALFSLISQIMLPTVSYALTDGPTAPEFSTFESVISTDMVNTFSGDLSYNLPVINVPGPSGSGYAMSLSYHQGMSAEQEASWVGFGWTLNPGVINRNKAGLADDFKDVKQKTYNKVPPSWTGNANKQISVTAASGLGFGLSANLNGRTYSNYGGFSKFYGFNLSGGVGNLGSGGLGVQFSNGEPTFSVSFTPRILSKALGELQKVTGSTLFKNSKSSIVRRLGGKLISSKNKLLSETVGNLTAINGSSYGMYARGQVNQQTSVTPFYGFSFRYSNTNTAYGVTTVTPFGWKYPFDFHPLGYGELGSFGFTGSVAGQGNIPVTEKGVNGYMYSNSTKPNSTIDDYGVEKQSLYNRRISHLGIPFANPDNFMVSGEKLNGAFRLRHDRVGHYYPNAVESITKIYNGGPLKEAGVIAGPLYAGAGVTIGTTFLSGKSKTEIEEWDHGTKIDMLRPNEVTYSGSPSNSHFRFTGDMGGEINYTGKNDVIYAEVASANGINFVPGARQFNPDLQGQFYNDINGGRLNNSETEITGTSSYIDYGTDNNKISNFEVTNENGERFVYGEAIYSKNESATQIHVENKASNEYITKSPYYMDGMYLEPLVDAQKPNSSSYFYNTSNSNKLTTDVQNNTQLHNTHIVGTYTQEPYATNYLMTEILTADYVDADGSGDGSENDFGGWTKFAYRQKYGGNTWYRWRMPYYGLKYEQGQISDKKDDMASVTSGEKEVKYLGQIETKTHIAFFVTNDSKLADFDSKTSLDLSEINSYLEGSGNVRLDGWSAKRPLGGEDAVSNQTKNAQNRGDENLENLEKIVLFSKSDIERANNDPSYKAKPIKTVRFDYNYSLCKGLPNSSGGAGENGKLTLKKVWTEYNGTSNTRISPYVFDYKYPQLADYGQKVLDEYGSFLSNYSGLQENPNYTPESLGRWGGNQFDGKNRFDKQQEWLYQGEYPQNTIYDPAAWQLKKITLPSGGQIHIHYEEKDYTKVQDENALAMVSLEEAGTIDHYTPANGGLITIVLNKLACQNEILAADVTNIINTIDDVLELGSAVKTNVQTQLSALTGVSNPNSIPGQQEIKRIVSEATSLMYSNEANIYFLNLNDIDINTTNADEVHTLKDKIEEEFIGKRDDCGQIEEDPKYIYFKFLYSLAGANPGLDNCRSEYIKGHVKVSEVGVVQDDQNPGNFRLFLRLGEAKMFDVQSPLVNVLFGNEEMRAVPKQACMDYLVARRMGVIDANDCDAIPTFNEIDVDLTDGQDGVRNLRQFDKEINDYYLEEATYDNNGKGSVDDDKGLAPMGKRDREYSVTNEKTGKNYLKGRRAEMREDVIRYLNFYGIADVASDVYNKIANNSTEYCAHIDHDLSYLRIPMLKAKRGGGIRVKRVMFYDDGFANESGDEALYGTEYDYVNEDGTSSGIATNEPQQGREENALVTLVERYEQSLFSKLVAGRYQQEFEGPIGEGIMPGASVGHSRVVQHNIYRNGDENSNNYGNDYQQWLTENKTLAGFMIYEYHTADEYPISENYRYKHILDEDDNPIPAVSYSNLQNNRKRDYLPIPLGIININIKKEWAAQGYNFIIHNKHGRMKAETVHSGIYERGKSMNLYPVVSKTELEYFEPGEKINLIGSDGILREGTPGKEMDIAMESKQVKETTSDFTLPFTIGLTIVGLPVTPFVGVGVSMGLGFTYSYNNSKLNTHLTSKVTHYPVILKSTKTYKEGVESKQEHLAFDAATGKPMLMRTVDEFDGEELAKGNGVANGEIHDGSYYTLNIPAHMVERYNSMGQKSKGNNTNQLSLTAGNIVTYGKYGNPLDYIQVEGSVGLFDIFDKETSEVSPNSEYEFTDLRSSVINASAQTFGQFNFTAANEGSWYGSKQPIDDTENTKWRAYQGFAYNTDRKAAHQLTGLNDLGSLASVDNKIYNAGTFTDFDILDYDNPGVNSNWIKATEITRYAQNGEALEEVNALDIYSTAHFDESTRLPEMIASNAAYNMVGYKSYENIAGSSSEYAHSGNYSYNTLNTGFTVFSNRSIPNEGSTLMFWAKNEVNDLLGSNMNASDGTNTVSLERIAQTGEWQLFVAKFYDAGNGKNIWITNIPSSTYIDDVRFQPITSEANCYVYDSQYRLVASFDDQHFGLYYEYNPEGKLVRKRIETERGFMTIQETQYNTPTANKFE